MFENRAVRRFFGGDSEKASVGGGGLEKSEDRGTLLLFSLPDIFMVVKSRRTRRMNHVVRMMAVRNAYTILVREPEAKRRQKKT